MPAPGQTAANAGHCCFAAKGVLPEQSERDPHVAGQPGGHRGGAGGSQPEDSGLPKILGTPEDCCYFLSSVRIRSVSTELESKFPCFLVD